MLLKIFRACILLFVIRATVAVPLGIEYDKTGSLTQEETENKVRLDAATAQAHQQVQRMREGFDRYKAGDAKAKALYEASFGKNANPDVVNNVITHLETGTLKAKLATHPFKADKNGNTPWANTPWTQKKAGSTWTAGHVQFGAGFHGQLNDHGRAGTIIHEATHQLSKTGDDVNRSGNIIKVSDGRSKPTGETGYTSNRNFHKTVAQVNAEKDFKKVRDSAANMHDNAESYAIFASLCSHPGNLRRRDLHLFNEALLNGDHEQLEHLSRRNACKLPPDYFAKKAAAKKAASNRAKNPGHITSLHGKKAKTLGHKKSLATGMKAVMHGSRMKHPKASTARVAPKAGTRGGPKPRPMHTLTKSLVRGTKGPKPTVDTMHTRHPSRASSGSKMKAAIRALRPAKGRKH